MVQQLNHLRGNKFFHQSNLSVEMIAAERWSNLFDIARFWLREMHRKIQCFLICIGRYCATGASHPQAERRNKQFYILF